MMGKSTFNNFLWRFLERCGAQIVTLIVSIVLARLLDPEVYGTVAIVTVIITLMQVFVDSGLGTSLIQKKDSDDLDFSSVFYFKVALCTIIYAALFFASPLIADFYGDMNLVWVIRVLGITILISSLKNVEQAYVSRNLLFKKFFFSTIIGTIISAMVGILMAVYGMGIWSLVAQTLTNNIVDTIVLWFTVGWRPIRKFSFDRLKKLASFGWKILVIGLMDNLYEGMRQLIIGKKYSSADLAFYNKGKQFPSLIVTNLSTAFDSVLLPTMSNAQDNILEVKKLVRKSISISSYALMPLMFGMAAVAYPFISVLLTEKWIESAFFIQVFAFSFAFYSINSAFKNGINAIGKSNVLLVTEVIKKSIGFGLIVATMFLSVRWMAISFLVSSILNIVINFYPCKKYFGYLYLEQLKDILSNLVCSLIMFVCIYPLSFINVNEWLKLIIIVPLGASIYFLLGRIFKLEGFYYYAGILKNILWMLLGHERNTIK